MRTVRRLLITLAVGCGAIAGLTEPSHAQLQLYDDFNAPQIDPDKWIGAETFTAPMNPNAEALRFIQSGMLRVILTTYGNTGTDSGTQNGRFGLGLPNPGPVTTIAATVTVRGAVAEDCPSNSEPSRALAQLAGSFFNDGSSPGGNDRTGDIIAAIHKGLDRDGQRIKAFINRCANAACTSFPTLASHVFATTWTAGVPHRLLLLWDPDGSQFVYGVNVGTPQQELAVLPYTQSDALPPVSAFKQIRAHNFVANCIEGRRKATMDTLFDNVRLNQGAVPQ